MDLNQGPNPSRFSVALRMLLTVAIVADPRMLLAQSSGAAPVPINLPPLTAPAAGQPAVTPFSIVGSNFPTGTITTTSVKLTLEPVVAGSGPKLEFAPTQVATVLTNTRRITFQVPGSVGVRPNVGKISESVTVRLHQPGGSLIAGNSTASFGAGIVVGGAAAGAFGPIAVLDAEHATAQIQIEGGASLGERVVSLRTGQTTTPLTDGFNVVGTTGIAAAGKGVSVKAPTAYFLTLAGQTSTGIAFSSSNRATVTLNPDAELVSGAPASGSPGQTVSVKLTGVNTNFFQGSTRASFGAGISVGEAAAGTPGPVTVVDAQTVTAQVVIAAGATLGPRTIMVTTGIQRAELVNGFAVVGGTPTPSITLNPNSGQRGLTLKVTVSGQNTHFASGSTKVALGNDITLSNLVVTSATQASADVSIAAGAVLGPRGATVVTGSETTSCANCFTVVAGNHAPVVSAGPDVSAQLPVVLPSRYQLSFLPTLGSAGSHTFDINELGDIAGASYDAAGRWLPTIWVNGKAIALSTLGGAGGAAKAIGWNGLVGGQSLNAAGQWRNFLFSNGRYLDLAPTFGGAPDGCCTWMMALNRLGHLVGLSASDQAFLYRDGQSQDLPSLSSGRGHATSINDKGVISGFSSFGSAEYAVRWIDGKIEKLPVIGPNPEGRAYDINNSGDLSGEVRTAANLKRAAIWRNGQVRELGPFSNGNETAVTVNDFGQVLIAGDKPTLWQDGATLDLSQFLGPATNSVIIRMNNRAQVVGYVGTFGSGTRAWVLNPLDNGNPTVTLSLNGTVTDDGLPAGGGLKVTWAKVSGPGEVVFATGSSPQTTATFKQPGTYVVRLTADDSAATQSDDVVVTISASNQAPSVDAGPDRSLSGPGTTRLSGSVNDDGLPSSGNVTLFWEKIAGPAEVVFGSPKAAATDVAFSSPGEYILRFSADDSQLAAADTVTINVVAAGVPTISTVAPSSGMQSQSNLSVSLTGVNTHFVNGTSTANFGAGIVVNSVAVTSATQATVNITIPASAVIGSRNVTLTTGVEVASCTNCFSVATGNQAPVVSAGVDLNITFPQVAPLAGTVTDDGVPVGSPLSVTWSRVSGPGTVTFSNPNTAVTSASFTRPGTYVLRISATDSILAASDEVTVTVAPCFSGKEPGVRIDLAPSSLIDSGGANAGSIVRLANGGMRMYYTGVMSTGRSAVVLSAISSDGLSWTRDSGVRLGPDGFEGMFAPEVVKLASGAMRMYFAGLTSSTWRIYSATSTDGIAWTQEPGTRVNVGGPQNCVHVNFPNVVPLAGGSMRMYFSCGDGLGTSGGKVLSATSENGLAWNVDSGVRIPANQSGTGLDEFASDPHVVNLVDGTYRMFYTGYKFVSGEGFNTRIFSSRSQDGLSWASETGVRLELGPMGAQDSLQVSSARLIALPDASYRLYFEGHPKESYLVSRIFSAHWCAVPGNNPPTVNAGPDVNLAPTVNVTRLTGSVTDDGQPVGASLSYAWTKVSGPGLATFSTPNAVATDVSFSAAGKYVLRLIADDTQLHGFDDMEVTVLSAILPIISSVTPNTGQQGQTNLAIQVRGTNTAFVQGATTVDFGTGIAVQSISVTSPTLLAASISIAPAAALGPRTVTVSTGSEVVSLANGFSVVPTPNQPPIVSANAGCAQTVPMLPSQHTISEYPLATVPGGPSGIAYGPDCSIWIADYFGNQIWRIAPDGNKTQFPVPNTRPYGIIVGPDNNLWFTEFQGNSISRITPAGAITRFAIPTSGLEYRYKTTEPFRMTVGPDGNIWFIEHAANQIAKITMAGVITEYKIPTGGVGGNGLVGSEPHDITAGPDGNIWFVEAVGNKIGKITTDGQITEYAIPTANALPSGIAAGADGNLWFTEASVNKIGRITTAGTFLPELAMPTANSAPQSIALARDGNIWVAQLTVGKISRITPAGVITEFSTSGPNPEPVSFASGPDGYLWFVELRRPGFARINVFTNVGYAALSGQASDDGLPASSTLTTQWTAQNPPSTASFSLASQSFPNVANQVRQAPSAVTLGAPGTYQLRLTGSDGSLSSVAPVTVTVLPDARLVSAVPNSGVIGQSNLIVTITGQGTHFVAGVSTASFGPGISVGGATRGTAGPITVTSPTSATAVLWITPEAQIGPQTVTVTTGPEAAALDAGFSVLGAAIPSISAVSPNTGPQGGSGPVAITGLNTHFVQGTTQIDFGPGITVSSIQITCPTCLSAQIAIAGSAAIGPRNVTVTTGSEVASLSGGFTVQPAASNQPPTITSSPARGPIWVNLPTSNPPIGRDATAQTYDAASDRMIFFSGAWSGRVSTSPVATDVWVLTNASGKNGTPSWLQVFPTNQGPGGGEVHLVAYAPTRNRLIVCGGYVHSSGGYATAGECWVLSNANGLGGAATWSPLPSLPSWRAYSAFHYDPTSNRIILFGGLGTDNNSKDDVLILADADGVGSPSWSTLTVPGTIPPHREAPGSFYDSASNRLVVFGGVQRNGTSSRTNLGDLWVLTNANGSGGTPAWAALSPTGAAPSARAGVSLAFDQSRNQAVVFAGYTQSLVSSTYAPITALNGTWILKNANGLGGAPEWQQLTPIGAVPAPRLFHQGGTMAEGTHVPIALGRFDTPKLEPPLADFSWYRDNWVLQTSSVRAAAGSAFSYDVDATDPENGALSFSFTSAPSGMTIHPATGLISFTPTRSQVGTFPVVVQVQDPQGLKASQSFDLVVADQANLPQLLGVVPDSGQPGQTVSVTITGLGTNFGQTTTLSVGAGLTISGLNAVSPTRLTGSLTISPAAQLGNRSFTATTGTQVLNLLNAFSVEAGTAPPTPSISSVSPSSGPQGGSGPVVIVGANTHFAQGITQLDLGPGITVSAIQVTCPTCLNAQLAIADSAAIGPRTVTVTTGSEVVTLSPGFTVNPGTPLITSFGPTAARQGQNITLTVGGRFTHFAQGTTTVSLGAGTTTNAVTVTNPSSLTAQITIASDAVPGTRTLVVTTGTESVSVANQFTIQPGIPVLLSSTPSAIQQGQTQAVAITGQFTNFTQGTTSVVFGAGVTVNSVAVSSKTNLTAQVTIAGDAALGARTLAVTTGAESVSLANALVITATPVIILTSVVPSSATVGQTLGVVINGQGTTFAPGTTVASFGPGISVGGAPAGTAGPVTVLNAAQATAQLTVAANAAAGPRTVVVQTGAQQVSLVGGFLVNGGTTTNQPPTVSSGTNQTIALPAAATLTGTVTDDGLPVGATLTSTWSKTSGPGTVTFANPSAPATTATFSLAGTYVLRLTATDTEFTVFSEVAVIVQAANQPPTITVNPTWSVVLPNRLLVTYTVSDDRLPSNGVLTVSWDTISGPGEVGYVNQTPSLNNEGSVSVGFSQAGTYVLRITATDTQFVVSREITVTVTGTPNQAPTVSLATPIEGQEVTTRVAVTGSVSATSIESWRVEIRGAEETAYRTIGTGTNAVQNGQLATFDPTVLLNGIYYIRLKANDLSGSVGTTPPVAVVVTKNQKIGIFTVSFNDLTVPLPGLPIQVVRTYDSRVKASSDFGYGWTLDLRSVRASANIVQGTQWSGTVTGGLVPTYCIQPTKTHVVTVVLPDGNTYRFQPTLTPACQQGGPIGQTAMGFSSLPGTVASLAIVGNNIAQVSGTFPGNFELLDTDTLQPIDPVQYRLTLPDGRSMVINVVGGLQNLTDLNGNRITITPAGIQHSNGTNVTFTRDTAQRITRITDPAGSFIDYGYDSATGDLKTVKDQEGNITTFLYSGTSHYLTDIQDPRGIKPIRNEYDASGRLVKHIDAFGKEILYTHNIGTRQEIVTDRLGNPTVNEYDDDGNVVKVTDAEGGITLRTYDSRGNTLSETNPLGKKRDFVYDAQDNRLEEKDPLGNITRYEYNSRKQVTKITDPEGRMTENTYDAATGNLTQTKDSIGGITAYVYNSAGLQTQITDPTGAVTRYQYDAAGNLTQTTDAENSVTTYTYDANRNKKSETRTRTTPTGLETLTTLYDYDKLNRLTGTTLPDGSTTQVTYNTIGKQATTTDQLNRVTRYDYDELGRLIRTTFPDNTTETSAYDFEGRRSQSTDREGRITRYQYDKLGRLRITTFADNATSESIYDSAGQVSQTFDARRNVTTFVYDDAGRRTRVTNALNQATQFAYDKVGNQVSITDANGFTTQFQYDANNRRTLTRHPDLTTDQVGYDAAGRSTSKTDQEGRVTQFRYDRLGRLTQVIDALNQVTSYTYDEAGNRTSQRDARANVTRFEYDKLGRRTKRTLPLGQSETFSYNAAGNLVSKTDFNGKTTAYQYDPSNNWLTRKTPDPSFSAPPITFSYWPAGQRRSMTDPSGTTNYAYDARYRLLQKQTPQGTLTYTYDVQGNLRSIRSSNTGGTSVDYSYDQLNRLDTVTDNRMAAPNVTMYTYDAVGNLKSYTYPNGVKHDYTYSNLNRLQQLAVTRGATTLASYAYTLGPTGNRRRVVEFGGRAVDYTYDELYRLKSETIAGGTVNGAIGYTYDPVGNRLARTSTVAPVPPQAFTYDNNDRLNTDIYDNAGNTTGSGGDTFAYDFENRLISKNNGQVTIIYDGDGNRVAKTVGGVTTRYLIDDRNLTGYAQVVEELAGGSVALVYTYGLNRISQSQAVGRSFYGYDGHGSVRRLEDAAGAITDRYDYDAFGNILTQVGNTPNNFHYAGEQSDANLGYYYLRARYLAPSTGRFLSEDPVLGGIFDPATLHRYTYGHNDPTNRIDPSGTTSLLIQTVIVSSLVSALATAVADVYIPWYRTRAFLPRDEALRKVLLSALAGAAGGAVGGTVATGIARVYGTQFVLQMSPWLTGARIGSATEFGTKLAEEYIKWTQTGQFYFKDASGRVVRAWAAGAAIGSVVARLEVALAVPVTAELLTVRTIRVPEFPYFTEVVVPHRVLIDIAFSRFATTSLLAANFFQEAFVDAVAQVPEQ